MNCDKVLKKRPSSQPSGLGVIALLLALAVLVLLVQLVISFEIDLLGLIDFRDWSRITWFAINSSVVVLLLAVRFGPEALKRLRNGESSRSGDEPLSNAGDAAHEMPADEGAKTVP